MHRDGENTRKVMRDDGLVDHIIHHKTESEWGCYGLGIICPPCVRGLVNSGVILR